MSDYFWPHGLQPTRLLRPWDFPGKSTGVVCHRLLQNKGLLQTKWKSELLNWNSRLSVFSKTVSHVVTDIEVSSHPVCGFIFLSYQVIQTTRRQCFRKWLKCYPFSHKYKSRQLCGSFSLLFQMCSRMTAHWAIYLICFEMQTGKNYCS